MWMLSKVTGTWTIWTNGFHPSFDNAVQEEGHHKQGEDKQQNQSDRTPQQYFFDFHSDDDLGPAPRPAWLGSGEVSLPPSKHRRRAAGKFVFGPAGVLC